METTAASPAESFATSAVTQNGGTNYHHPSAPTPTTTVNNFNGKASSHFDDTVAEGLDDEDDYGPETDVDTVDESSQIKNVFDSTSATKSNNFDKSILELDHSGNVADGDNTLISEKAEELANADGSLSEESDEDGWKYVEGHKENKENNSPDFLHGGESTEDMSFSLNPNAIPFIPTSPVSTRSKEGSITEESPLSPMSDTRDRLLTNDVIASSPMKGFEKSLEHVDVPSLDEFTNEISKRPSDITSNNCIENHSGDADSSVHSVSFSSIDHEASNETLLGVSTKAVYGDESSYADNLADISKDLHLHEKEHAAAADFSTPRVFKFEDDSVKLSKEDILEKDTITSASSTTMSLSTEDIQNAIDKDLDNEKSQFNDSDIAFGRSSLDFNNGSVVPEFNSILNNTTAGSFNEGPDKSRKYSDDFSFENYHSTVDTTSAYLTSFKESVPSHSIDFTDAENPMIKSNIDFTEEADSSVVSDADKDGHHFNPFSTTTAAEVNKTETEPTDLIDDKYDEFYDKIMKNEKNLEIGRKTTELESLLTNVGVSDESGKQQLNGSPDDVILVERNDSFQLDATKKSDFHGFEQDFDDSCDYNKKNGFECSDFEVGIIANAATADGETGQMINTVDDTFGCDNDNINAFSFELDQNKQHDEKIDEVAENINKIVKEPGVDFLLDRQNPFEREDFDDISSSVVTSDSEAFVVDKDEVQKTESVGSLEPEMSFETMIYKEVANVEYAPPPVSDVTDVADDRDSDDEGNKVSSCDVVDKQAEVIETGHRKKLADTVDEPFMCSIDAQTPYKHDCSRINAEDPIAEKHFDDLTPTFNDFDTTTVKPDLTSTFNDFDTTSVKPDLTPTFNDFDTTTIKPDLTCELKTTPDLLSNKVDPNIIIDTEAADPYQSMFYNEMPESDYKRNELESEDIYVDKDKPESDLEIIKETVNDNSTASDQDSTYPLSENQNIDFFVDDAVPRNNDVVTELDNEIERQQNDELAEQNQEAIGKIVNSIVDAELLGVSEMQTTSHEEKFDLSKDELKLHAEVVDDLKQTEDNDEERAAAIECSTPPTTPVPSSIEEFHVTTTDISPKIDEVRKEMEEVAEESKQESTESNERNAAGDGDNNISAAAVFAASAVTAVAVGTAVAAVGAVKTESKKPVEKSTPATVAAVKKADTKRPSLAAAKTTTTAAKTTTKPKSPAVASSSTVAAKKYVPIVKSSPKQSAPASRILNAKPTSSTVKTTTSAAVTSSAAAAVSKAPPAKPKTITATTGSVLNKSGTTKSTLTATATSKPRPISAPAVKSPKQPIANGDVLKTAVNKVASSVTAAKKPSSASAITTSGRPAVGSANGVGKPNASAAASTRPAVNLATRTSLAPKSKPTTATTTVKTELISKVKSTTAVANATDKKSSATTAAALLKDVDKKPLPIKRASLTSRLLGAKTCKTDVKSPPVKKMAGSATAVAIRKPVPPVTSTNQIDVPSANETAAIAAATKHNGHVSDDAGNKE